MASSCLSHLDVLPPVLPLELNSLLLELGGALLKIVGTFVEFGDLLIAFKNLLDVDAHDVHDFSDLKSALDT